MWSQNKIDNSTWRSTFFFVPALNRLVRTVLALFRNSGFVHVFHHLLCSGNARKVFGRNWKVLHRKKFGHGRRVGAGPAAGRGQLPPCLKLGQPQTHPVANFLIFFLVLQKSTIWPFIPCVSGIWTSLTWFDFRLESIFGSVQATPKRVVHFKSDPKIIILLLSQSLSLNLWYARYPLILGCEY